MTANTLTPKGHQTKQRILDVALRLFEERGYEGTTVRDIAAEAGVALGNVYRYFNSKEDFVLAFYEQLAHRQNEEATAAMQRCSSLRERLIVCVRCKLSVVDRYHEFFTELFSVAARPGSILNPFAEASRPTREVAIASFEEVIDGSKDRVPSDLRAELPWLLWFYCMGIILFWLHDASAARYKTHHLIESTADIISRTIAIVGSPVISPIRGSLIQLIRTLKS